jgi:hypothetical protein
MIAQDNLRPSEEGPLRQHVPAICVILILVICLSFFASSGAWDLFAAASRPATTLFSWTNGFFDAQGDRMLEGRWDVPCDSIGSEAWIYEDKCYGYFGFSPALPRIPLNFAFASMHGHWTPVLSLVATLINLVAAYLLFLQARKVFAKAPELSVYDRSVAAIFLVAVGLGSTNLFLLNEPNIYHEALLWGGAFALLSYWALIRFLDGLKGPDLAATIVFGFLAINARPLNGAGPAFALTAVILLSVLSGMKGGGRPGVWASKFARAFVPSEAGARVSPVLRGLGLGLALATLLSPFVVMYLKFGEPMPDFSHHVQIMDDPARLARTGGALSSLGNVPFHLSFYFATFASSLSADFPWITMVPPDWTALQRFPGAKIDYLEQRVHPVLTMPPFFVFGALGLWACAKGGVGIRPFRIAALSAFAAGSLVFFAVSGSQRYIHDFFPLFVLAAAVGLAYATSFCGRAARLGTLAALIVLAALGIHVNMVSVYQSRFTSLHIKNAMADTLVAVWEAPRRDGQIRRLYPDLYHRAADIGDAEAQHAIALIYDKGDRISQDRGAAMRWYEESALAGSADAQFRLGLHYLQGDVRRPHEEGMGRAMAWAWLAMAAQRGHPVAAQARDALVPEMTAGDRFWAVTLARMFSESIRNR